MTNDDRKMREIAAVFSFYDRELSDAHMRVWLDVLDEFDATSIAAAIKAHLADPDAGAYCPKPADLIRQLRGNVDEAAALAWSDVINAARNGGADSLDAVTLQALQALGGLSVVQRADESQNTFLRKAFVDAFRAFRHREERAGIATAASLLNHEPQRIAHKGKRG